MCIRDRKNRALWAIAALSFLAIFALQLPFPWIVLGAAALGWLGGRLRPQHFQLGGAHGAAKAGFGPALIDDHTPPPEHARFKPSRLAAVLAGGLALWAVPMAWLVSRQGWDGAYTQMGWFFTKAALLTFGGAYAVLPYVYQGAVEQHGWLSATQMIDGLALGETTPGPLIMVVAFVGFVGGYTKALLGPDALFMAGALAATLVTWFTFLPSFIFILAGGPLVERTHDDLRFTAPLTAITAAVVGVIANLALFFGWHVWWPQGWGGPFDAASAALTVLATVALLRFKRGVIEVIVVSALIGLALSLLR